MLHVYLLYRSIDRMSPQWTGRILRVCSWGITISAFSHCSPAYHHQPGSLMSTRLQPSPAFKLLMQRKLGAISRLEKGGKHALFWYGCVDCTLSSLTCYSRYQYTCSNFSLAWASIVSCSYSISRRRTDHLIHSSVIPQAGRFDWTGQAARSSSILCMTSVSTFGTSCGHFKSVAIPAQFQCRTTEKFEASLSEWVLYGKGRCCECYFDHHSGDESHLLLLSEYYISNSHLTHSLNHLTYCSFIIIITGYPSA